MSCCPHCGKSLEQRPFGEDLLEEDAFSPSETTIIRMLVDAAGKTVRYEALFIAIYGDRHVDKLKSVAQFICRIRLKLIPTRYKVLSVSGRGWRLIRTG